MRWPDLASAVLLATVVSAVAVPSVQAAETPRAPEPLRAPETVRACPGYGPGFIQVPGTQNCVRISGRATSEYTTSARRISRDDIAGFGTNARVSIDSRTQTEYGPLRGYLRMRAGTGGIGPRD